MATKKDNNAAQDAAAKALAAVQAKKSAEKAKVQHNITHVEQQTVGKTELLAVTRKNAMPYRVAAIILWILAIAFEVLAILFFKKVIKWDFALNNPGYYISWIVCIVLDFICVMVGSLLWKKANHLDPASAKNKTKFWLHNNLGVIVAVIAFAPFIIFVLTDKKADKQSKTIATAIAAVLIIAAVLVGIDWNPVSQEQMLEEAGIDTGAVYEHVYWTKGGKVYHLYEDCGHLNNSSDLLEGTSQAAVENGKTRMCQDCSSRGVKEGLIIEENNDDKIETPTDEVVPVE